MSLPAPVTVNVPPAAVADPASAGLPMSRLVHGAGRPGVVPEPVPTWTFVNVAVASVESTRCSTASPTYTDDVMLMVAEPIDVQDVPFADR